MKFLFVFALVIVAALAEPPVRRVFVARYPANQRQTQFVPLPISGATLARQELPENFSPVPSQNVPQQNFPSQNVPQQSFPSQNYPRQNYPQQNYAQPNYPQQNYAQQNYAQQNYPQQNFQSQNFPPQPTTPEPERNATQDSEEIDPQYDSKAVQNKSNNKDENEKSEKLVGDENVQLEEGVYYLYHPSGLLQKVAFSTSNDVAKMAFNAQLQLQNVDPISAPIYTYDPNSFLFQEIQY